MILTPIDNLIHIRADISRRCVAVFDPARAVIEIKDNTGEKCEVPIEELLREARRLGAVKVSFEGGGEHDGN